VIQRSLTVVVVVGVAVALACVDMSAPNGPAAISNLKLPSPSVVVGDVMRDSNGTPAPLTITAFDANGVPAIATGAQFFITDTVKAAHLAGGTLLTGDKIGSTVIIGQVGSLQTNPVTVPVTFLPFKMAKTATGSNTGPDTTLVAPLTADTTVTSVANLSLRVSSALDSASQGIVVRYTIARTLTPKDVSRPAVIIGDNSNKPAKADTTSAAGISTRKLIVFPALLGDAALLAGTKTDTAIVEARASYKGAELNGSPVRFIIAVRVSLSGK
jgi:hypothetical protein